MCKSNCKDSNEKDSCINSNTGEKLDNLSIMQIISYPVQSYNDLKSREDYDDFFWALASILSCYAVFEQAMRVLSGNYIDSMVKNNRELIHSHYDLMNKELDSEGKNYIFRVKRIDR